MGFIENIRALVDPTIISDRALEFPATPMAANTIRPLTASGQRIDLASQQAIDSLRYRPFSEWQNDAWSYYDAIGEIKYGFGMLGAVMSRVRLYASLNLDPDAVPTATLNYRRRQQGLSDDERQNDVERELTPPDEITAEVMEYAEQLVKDLERGPGGISGFLRTYALNMSIPGECFMVEIDGVWCIKSSSELVVDAGNQIVLRPQRFNIGNTTNVSSTGAQSGDRVLPEDTKMIRIWREHPRYSNEPESSMLGLREVCDELITLQRMIRAISRTNMNAGILYVPDGITNAGESIAEDIAQQEEQNNEVVQTLYDNFTEPVLDETNYGTVVPTLLTGPDHLGEKIKYIEVNRKVDQYLIERTDRTLERILQGLDMPKDFVTGLANVRYTNAKNIDESLYKSHIEPLVLMLVDALTTAYLRPQLQEKFPKLSPAALDTLGVWYDPSAVVTKADPADSADKGFDKFAVSADAWRAAHGFSDTDAPSELEIATRMLEKSTLPPELITSLFNTVLETVMLKQREQSINENNMPQSARGMLYDGATDAPEPDIPEGNPNDIIDTSEDDTPLAASAAPRIRGGLYTTPYDGNDMQDRYRLIAEAAVRAGEHTMTRVRTADLTPTQPADRTHTKGSGAGAKDLPPIAIHHNGTVYLLDGHHRASTRRVIEVALVDIDNQTTHHDTPGEQH